MDIIWNLTRICPWNCAICCMSAIHAKSETRESQKTEQKNQGLELSQSGKLQLLKDLCQNGCDIDFSGGDPLYYEEDFEIVEQATKWLPPEKISVSMTGAEVTDQKIELLKKVDTAEFTIDCPPDTKAVVRPSDFHTSSLEAMKRCVEAGVKTRAVTVFYQQTMDEYNLKKLYQLLCQAKVDEWELLRFYSVGRAGRTATQIPEQEEYFKAMDMLRAFNGYTKVFFQHSLRMLEGNGACPAVNKALGILPDGRVMVCAWAVNSQSQPIDPSFVLGKMPEQKLSDIIRSARERVEFQTPARACRVIKYINSQNKKDIAYANNKSRM